MRLEDVKAKLQDWDAVEVLDATRLGWVINAIAYLERHRDDHTYSTSSGDSMIIVHRVKYLDGQYSYDVTDCKIRRRGIFNREDIENAYYREDIKNA